MKSLQILASALIFTSSAPLVLAQAAKIEPAKVPSSPRANSSADQAKIDSAIAKVYPSLVRIHVVSELPKEGRMQKRAGSGSGTIIHPDGYILTNHHVAGDATRVWVRLSNKMKIDAKVIGTDPQTDLCVIKLNMDQIPASMKPLPVAKFGDFKTLNVGDSVLAMGSPAGVSQSVTLGVVANLEMIIPGGGSGLKQSGENVGALVRWIGHDAVIYFGNSGGPLVNLKGEIIGINEIGLGSLGGAIPADIAKYVASELIKNGTVRRSWTGLITQPLLHTNKSKDGVLVSSVVKDSPADKAGFKTGDIITKYDGVAIQVTAPEHLPLYNKVVLGTPVGKEVAIEYLRDGKSATTKLTTIERSAAKGADEAISGWGITARNLTKRSAIRLKKKSTEGVYVSSIGKAGPSASSKPALKAGDLILKVNGQGVKDLAQLKAITTERTKGEKKDVKTLVEFERKGQLIATVIELNKEPNPSQSSAAKKAWLGVETQVLTRELAKLLNLGGKKGVRITQVIPNTTAAKAELKSGDIILKLDGMVIAAERERDANIFNSMIREYDTDSSIDLDIIRDGKPMKITCDLEPSPTPAREFKTHSDDVLEFTVRELSKAQADEAKHNKGVFVQKVEASGWSSLAGLKAGDVILTFNGKEVNALEAITAELKTVKEKKIDYITLLVKRGNTTRWVEIHPIWN